MSHQNEKFYCLEIHKLLLSLKIFSNFNNRKIAFGVPGESGAVVVHHVEQMAPVCAKAFVQKLKKILHAYWRLPKKKMIVINISAQVINSVNENLNINSFKISF